MAMQYLYYKHTLLICLFGYIPLLGQMSNDLKDLQVDVIYLSSNYVEGRETGTIGAKRAADYIISRFEEIGLTPLGDANSYVQAFEFEAPGPNPKNETLQCRNIIGYINHKAKNTIVIGAHYDHIGYGAYNSKSKGMPEIHNGADDNASGIGGLLYLAEKLMDAKLKKNNYIIVAFSGEEIGLYGSQHFVANPNFDFNKVHIMLNLNKIGRLNEQKSLSIDGTGTSPAWNEILPRINGDKFSLNLIDEGIGASDHLSFYLKNISALHFSSGDHEDLHTPTDDNEKINYEGIIEISDFVLSLIEQLNRLGRLPFVETISTTPQNNTPTYKVSLGVRPNYESMEGGVPIDQVTKDRPAFLAGILPGDIVIQIGTVKVENIYHYMEGLKQFEPGDEAIVKVKRGNEVLEITVTF